MGGKTEVGWGGSTVNVKGTPVFAIDRPGPGPQVTCTPPTTLLRRRLFVDLCSQLPK
jgi:hypothetical protein